MGTTQYGVQAFKKRGKALLPEQPILDRDRDAMLRKGERLAKEKAGVLVYQVEVDDEIGDVDEPVILARHGEVPAPFADVPI